MIPTCSTCRYFVPDDEEEAFVNDDGEVDLQPAEGDPEGGTCHRHAPQPTMYCFLPQALPTIQSGPVLEEDEGPDTTTIWPAVDAEDYCGEFKMIDRKGKK